MTKLEFAENGLHAQFIVDDYNHLQLFNLSDVHQDIPDGVSTEMDIHAAVEAETAGARILRNRHVFNLCPTELCYDSHTDTRNAAGRLLTFVLKNEQLTVRQCYQFYTGTKVVRSYAEVENTGTQAAELTYVSSFCYAGFGGIHGRHPYDQLTLYIPHNSWCEELNWRSQTLRDIGLSEKDGGVNRTLFCISSRGCWSTKDYMPMGLLQDAVSGETCLWQIESNAGWQWEFGTYGRRLYFRASGPDDLNHQWRKVLQPGKSFRTVAVAFTLLTGSISDAVREMTAYRRQMLPAGVIDRRQPVIFNDYMDCLNAAPSTEKELPLIDRAAALGAEIYCMDAGWFTDGHWWPSVGEWQICEERFDGRIDEVFARIREKGMIPGIWLEPEVMGVDCPLVPEFSDCFYTYLGRPIICNGRYQLDFRKEKVRRHLDQVVDYLIDRLGVGYFKFDYNIDPLYGTETDADSVGDGLVQCARAYLQWIDSVRTRHPGLLIENCSSGGMRMDYATLQHFPLQSISDAAFYNEFAHMGAMVVTAALPEQAGIWTVARPEYAPNEVAFAAVNGLLNRLYFGGRIDRLTEEQFVLLQAAVDCYKGLRDELLTMHPWLPCGLCHLEDDSMVGGRISPDGHTAYLSVAHMRGDGAIDIPLPETLRDAAVTVLYPENGAQTAVAGGCLQVALPAKSAVLLKLSHR